MSSEKKQRRQAVALITFKVTIDGTGTPVLDPGNVLNLNGGDRLRFTGTDAAGNPKEVLVDLGTTLNAQVRVVTPPAFDVSVLTDGRFVVKLQGGGNDPPTDPP